MIEHGIYNLLTNNAALTAVIGSEIFFGVNPNITNKNMWVVFTRNGTIPSDTKGDESSTGKSYLDTASITINVYGRQAEKVGDVSKAVRAALDRNSGTFAGCEIQSIQYKSQTSMFSYVSELTEEGLFQINQTYDCRFVPSY